MTDSTQQQPAPTIPVEAVEAAAKALFAMAIPATTGGISWDEHPESRMKDAYRKDAQAALEAASPYMKTKVTTRAEQISLPSGSVILTNGGGIFQHLNGYWFEPGSGYRRHFDVVGLPATVLHIGATK